MLKCTGTQMLSRGKRKLISETLKITLEYDLQLIA